MRTRRFRLTKTAKILIFLMIVALLGGGVFAGLKTGVIKTKEKEYLGENIANNLSKNNNTDAIADEDGNVINTVKTDNKTINLSLDEWIGWKPIIDANGGLSTREGSIYNDLGISVNISIINDATQSSNALVSGKLDAAGYTINRVAFLSNKFKELPV